MRRFRGGLADGIEPNNVLCGDIRLTNRSSAADVFETTSARPLALRKAALRPPDFGNRRVRRKTRDCAIGIEYAVMRQSASRIRRPHHRFNDQNDAAKLLQPNSSCIHTVIATALEHAGILTTFVSTENPAISRSEVRLEDFRRPLHQADFVC